MQAGAQAKSNAPSNGSGASGQEWTSFDDQVLIFLNNIRMLIRYVDSDAADLSTLTLFDTSTDDFSPRCLISNRSEMAHHQMTDGDGPAKYTPPHENMDQTAQSEHAYHC